MKVPVSPKGLLILSSKLVLPLFLLVAILAPNKTYATPASDSLLGYWKLDNSFADSSGHSNNFDVMIGTGGSFHDSSKAPLNFNNPTSADFSLTDHISQPTTTGLQPINALTFSLWVYLEEAKTDTPWIIGGNYYAQAYDQGFYFVVNSSSLKFYSGSPSMASCSSSHLPTGQWKLLTGTWDGSTIKLYVDGVLKGSQSYIGSIAYTGTNLKLGGFPGKVDDVRLYNRALSPAEITELAAGNHPTATWTAGTGTSSYETAANWSTQAVPDPYTRVIIANTNYDPVFSANEELAKLVINADAVLDILGYNLVFKDNGLLENNGTLKLHNSNVQTVNGYSSFDYNSGTVEINYATDTGASVLGSHYYNLTINKQGATLTQSSALVVDGNLLIQTGNLAMNGNLAVGGNLALGDGNLALSGNLDVNGDLDITGGIFSMSASGRQINVSGDWKSLGYGSFVPNGSTVILDGIGQSIMGSNSFYQLTKIATAADTLLFQAGSAQTITNTLTLQGTASQIISLRSITDGSPWYIAPTGTRVLDYLDVKDSYNSSGTDINTTAHHITDSGGNEHWAFDTTAPSLSEITQITSQTKDTTPSYTFSSTEAGTITYSGSCSASDTTAAAGNNTITFNTLAEGTYSNCTITVTDVSGNTSSALTVSSFTVDTTAPTVNITSPTSGSSVTNGTVIVFTDNDTHEPQCSIDNVAWISCTSGTTTLSQITGWSSIAINGTFTLYLRDIDIAGNKGTSSNSSLTKSDVTAPVLTQTKPIPTLIKDTTPDYYFSSTEAGTITFAGACRSTTTTAIAGENVITFLELKEGTHSQCAIRVTDPANNASAPLAITPFTIDATAPIISNIAAFPGSHSATISWNTNENTNSQVKYGKTTSYGRLTAETEMTAKTTSHSASIAELAQCTIYHYVVRSKDAAGNETTSADQIFKTGDCPVTTADDDDDEDDEEDEEDEEDDTTTSDTNTGSDTDSTSGTSDSSDATTTTSTEETTTDSVPNSNNDTTTTGTSSTTPSTTSPSTPSSTPLTTPEDPNNSNNQNYNGATTSDWQTKYFGTGLCLDENKCGSLADPDRDGLSNGDEFRMGTNPNVADSDNDGIDDSSEVKKGHNPAKAPSKDKDDKMEFEDAKEKGDTDHKTLKVEDVAVVDHEGESKIKLQGKAMPNSYVTVYIYSETPTIVTVATDENGNWSYILDKDLEDGEHQVYVAVTDNTGKIINKSEPLAFIKTAQAITKLDAQGGLHSSQADSPMKKTQNNVLKFIIALSVIALLVAISAIGFHLKKNQADKPTSL